MNMKNKAFTLSEVLITLVIIGIVAAITVPTLSMNTQKQQYITAYKKFYSSLWQVTNKIRFDNGGYIEETFSDDETLITLFQQYYNGAKVCQKGSTAGECWHENWYTLKGAIVASDENSSSSLILQDGTIMLFTLVSPTCTSSGELKDSIGCARIRADVNGFRGPNRVGRDIFDFYILKDKVIARGDPLTLVETSNPDGWGKGYLILKTGKLD